MNRGMSLIETMIALLVLSVIGTAVGAIITQAAAANNTARMRHQAIASSEEGLEQTRNFYQINGWIGLAGKGNSTGICYGNGQLITTTGCILPPPDTSGCGADGAVLGNHRRSVKIITSGNQVKVSSVVSWQDKQQCSKTVAETYFFNY